MEKRNIAVCIILSFITCGIYGIVWYIQMTDDAARVGDDNSMSGGMALLLTILTCGLYQYYWAYKMGKVLESANGKDNSTLYLILQILGLSIVNYCLIQSELNELVD